MNFKIKEKLQDVTKALARIHTRTHTHKQRAHDDDDDDNSKHKTQGGGKSSQNTKGQQEKNITKPNTLGYCVAVCCCVFG